MTVESRTYTQRSDDVRIAELQAKIDSIKTRGERKKARANPAVRLSVQAAKLLDKALNATDNAVLRKALEEARTTVGAAVAVEGWALPQVGSTEKNPAVKRARKNSAAMATASA